MDGKALARIGAIIFVALAITATAIEVNRPAERLDDPVAQVRPAPARDPLRAELARCGAMGEAGGRDPSCLRAWAENRRRFLGRPAPAASPEPTAPIPSTPDQNGSR
ncbi:MAG: putative entry exclusion protein TrbK-alt [Roseomonas sp.]|jgi:conjugative transfer region protein TrbK|nr:putative entry exclusion protein TrbK-alt [Roseomonas sp.]